MKQFAFPFSVYFKNDAERNECLDILKDIGYYPDCRVRAITPCYIGTKNSDGLFIINLSEYNKYLFNRHHIPNFDAALVRDIAAACTNDTWQRGEPFLYMGKMVSDIVVSFGKPVGDNWTLTRPTLEQICEHHGYEIKDRDIVKKSEQKQPEPKHKCSVEAENNRLVMIIEDMEKELVELRSKLKQIANIAQ